MAEDLRFRVSRGKEAFLPALRTRPITVRLLLRDWGSLAPGKVMDGPDDSKGRRRALQTFIAAGSAAFGCTLAAPAIVLVLAPVRTSEGGGAARWIRTVRAES